MSRRRKAGPRRRDVYSGILLVMCCFIILGMMVVIFGLANGKYAG